MRLQQDSQRQASTVSVYVDDLLIACVEQGMVESTIKLFRDAYIDITVHRADVHSYIGMTMDFSNTGKVHVSMTGYTRLILSQVHCHLTSYL